MIDREFDDVDYSDVMPNDPAIAQDEYSFIQWALERWHDRAFEPKLAQVRY